MRFSTLSACALAMLFVTGCNLPPDLEPLVVKRSPQLDAKGGIDMGGLPTRAEANESQNDSIRLLGTVRLWTIDRKELDRRISVGAYGAFARVLNLDSAQRLATVLDEFTSPEDRGRNGLVVPQFGSASVEFTRQVAYLSSWSIAISEDAMAADPSVDVAHFGARLTLRSTGDIVSMDGCTSPTVDLTIEIAEPNRELRSETLDLGTGSDAMIEIPLSTRLSLHVADSLGSDEALLIAAPDLTNLDRGIVILLEVAAPTTP